LYVTVAEEVSILRSALDTREAECDELKAQILAERTPCDMDLVATLRAQLATAEEQLREREIEAAECKRWKAKAERGAPSARPDDGRVERAAHTREFAEYLKKLNRFIPTYELDDHVLRFLAAADGEVKP